MDTKHGPSGRWTTRNVDVFEKSNDPPRVKKYAGRYMNCLVLGSKQNPFSELSKHGDLFGLVSVIEVVIFEF